MVTDSSAVIVGDRFVAVIERLSESGRGLEVVEIPAKSTGEAVTAVRKVLLGRVGYPLECTLVKLERVAGQPCKRVWAGKLKFEWQQVDVGPVETHRHYLPPAIGLV